MHRYNLVIFGGVDYAYIIQLVIHLSYASHSFPQKKLLNTK